MKTVKQISEVLKAYFNPSTDCERIEIDYPTLKGLVNLGIANLDETQNYSPSIQDFLAFYEVNNCGEEEVVFEAYVVTDREDSRITVEGIQLNTLLSSKESRNEFINLFRVADGFEVNENRYRAWWD